MTYPPVSVPSLEALKKWPPALGGGTQCERRSEESGLVRMIAEFVTQTERYYLVRQECIEMEASPLQGARSVDKGTHQKSAETSRDETITD